MSHQVRPSGTITGAAPAVGWAGVLGGLALVAAACGVHATGSAAPRRPAAAPVSTSTTRPAAGGPATTTPAPTPVAVPIQGDNGDSSNRVLADAIADLQSWWSTQMPSVFHQAYVPVKGGFFAVDPGAGALPPCAASVQTISGNAYYCAGKDVVAWDEAGFMPKLAHDYGPFTPAVVMAHEWGHAIQARVSFVGRTVTRELQADCYAGAWVRHIDRNESARFHITTADLDEALAGFVLFLRDEPGADATNPQAHGSGFDRASAFQDGFAAGVATCARYHDGAPAPLEFPFTKADAGNGGNLPYDQLVPGALASLESFWAQAYPQVAGGRPWKPLAPAKPFAPSAPPTCGGRSVGSFSLFYCVPEDYIGFDTHQAMPRIYQQGGDMAVGALLATQYGLAVENRMGDVPADEESSTLRGDCYAGAWGRSLLPYAGNPSQLVLSAGDLDEMISALLVFRGEGDRQRQGPGFNRVRAFRVGVVSGVTACTNHLKDSG